MSVILSLLISLSALLPTASAPAAPPYSYVLMEGGTGTLLYAENGEAVVPAHHSAKLMTLLLTAEAIDSGRLPPTPSSRPPPMPTRCRARKSG